jgi:hypothetical protein
MTTEQDVNAAVLAECRARLAYAEKFFAKLRKEQAKQAKPADDAAHDTKTETEGTQQ